MVFGKDLEPLAILRGGLSALQSCGCQEWSGTCPVQPWFQWYLPALIKNSMFSMCSPPTLAKPWSIRCPLYLYITIIIMNNTVIIIIIVIVFIHITVLYFFYYGYPHVHEYRCLRFSHHSELRFRSLPTSPISTTGGCLMPGLWIG